MRTFHYRPGKNALLALFMGILAAFTASLWWADDSTVTLIFALIFASGSAKAGVNAMSSEPALKFDHRAVWVRKSFGGLQEVPWTEVQGISLQVVTVRHWGIIPVSRTEYIEIACNGSVLGRRRLRLTAGSIELPRGGAAELIHTLQAAQMDAVGQAGVAMAGGGKRGWGVDTDASPKPSVDDTHDPGFDPDAAIARYLAAKKAGGGGAIAASAAPDRPAVPQRPVFGRRAA